VGSISKKTLESITSKALRLDEICAQEASKKEFVANLDLRILSHWERQISSCEYNLSDRIELLTQNKNDYGFDKEWIEELEIILFKYDGYINYRAQASLIIKKSNLIFQDILIPFIDYAIDLLDVHVQVLNKNISLEGINSYLSHLLNAIHDISSFCIAEDYNSYFENADISKTDKFSIYRSSFDKKYATRFFVVYSSLARILVSYTKHWVSSLILLIQRFNRDKFKIQSDILNGKEVGIIMNVIPETNPSYEYGGISCQLELSDTKLIYKPRSGVGDVFYQELVDLINVNLKKEYLRAPNTMNMHDYTWQEYVENRTCIGAADVKKYYERLGFLAAILEMVGSVDYHFGNIIADGEHPIFVDHETVFGFLRNDELSTGLGKSKILASGKCPDYSSDYKYLSAFQSTINYDLEKCYWDKNYNVEIRTNSYEWKGKNIPLLDNAHVNPLEYIDQMIEGYSGGLKISSEIAHNIVELANRNLNESFSLVRFLFRQSIDYFNILKESLQPQYLKDGLSRSLMLEELFDSLYSSEDFKKYGNVVQREVIYMFHYFIPKIDAFWVYKNQDDLIAIDDITNSYIQKMNSRLENNNDATQRNERIEALKLYMSLLE